MHTRTANGFSLSHGNNRVTMGIGLKKCFAQWKGWQKRYRILCIYAVASILSIAVSLLYSFSIPTVYTAETMLIDENSEMDILVGINHTDEWFQEKESWDDGINDIEIYAQLLDSREFAVEMSQVRIPGYNMDYLEHVKKHHRHPWWYWREYESDDEEALKQIGKCIRHRVIPSKQTLTLQVVDPDPVVSAMMVDSVSSHLQKFIASKRLFVVRHRYESLAGVRDSMRAEFLYRQKLFAEYNDAHYGSQKVQEKSHLKTLKNNKEIAHKTFSIVNQQYLRLKAQLEKKSQPFYTIKMASVPLYPSNPQYVVNILAFLVVTLLLTTLGVLYKFVDNSGRSIQFGNLFSPWSITIAVWIFMLAGIYLEADELYPLSNQFYICLAIWLTVFCLSSFTTFNVLPRLARSVRIYKVTMPFNSVAFNFFFVISVIVTPLYLYSIIKIVSQFGTEEMAANIRIFAVHGNESFGYLSLSYVLNQALLIMALWRYPRIPLWKLITVYCMALMNALAIMEKGMLFYIIIITVFVLYEKRFLRMRSVFLIMGVIVVLFFAFNLSRATEESGYAEEASLLDFFLMYVLSPPVAFGTVTQDISLLPGSHTLQAVYKLLNNWGFGPFVINEKVQDFVFVPISTNVYTIFQPFFEDFKYTGIAFFALVYGTISGWMYRLYQNGNAVGKAIYTYMIYLLVLQFYQENLFLNIIQVSQFVFFVLIVQQGFVGFSGKGRRTVYPAYKS